MPTKTIVCLANSRKGGARCIAGIEFMNNQRFGEWVRPVSNRTKGEISLREQAYRDNSEPGLLDLIDIPLIEPKPSGYQKENWLIVPGSQWKKSGHLNHGHLKRLATRTGPLWINGHNSRGGENDCMPIEETKKFVRSLILADVGGMVLRVSKLSGKLLLRTTFTLKETRYNLSVTDPFVESEYFKKGVGEYDLGESYLTVSLGEEFKGNTYKLVAGIIPRDIEG